MSELIFVKSETTSRKTNSWLSGMIRFSMDFFGSKPFLQEYLDLGTKALNNFERPLSKKKT